MYTGTYCITSLETYYAYDVTYMNQCSTFATYNTCMICRLHNLYSAFVYADAILVFILI